MPSGTRWVLSLGSDRPDTASGIHDFGATAIMKLAAIDIGSNAVRLQISSVLERVDEVLFKKLEYVRFPLRLGHDVFNTNRIGEQSIERCTSS